MARYKITWVRNDLLLLQTRFEMTWVRNVLLSFYLCMAFEFDGKIEMRYNKPFSWTKVTYKNTLDKTNDKENMYPYTPLLYNKTGVYRGIHCFLILFCSKT